MFISSETWHNQSGCDLTKKKKKIQVLPTCVAEVVCSETFLNTWSDFFWKKYKNKKKKQKKLKKKSQVQKPSNEKIARSVTADWFCCFSWFFFFLFPNGFTKKYMTYLPPPSSENKKQKNNANLSHSIIASLISPKALSCTLVRRGSAVFSLASMSEVYT